MTIRSTSTTIGKIIETQHIILLEYEYTEGHRPHS